MQQLALDFNPVRQVPRISHRSYGGWTPSRWAMTPLRSGKAIEPFTPSLREQALMALTRENLARHEIESRLKMKPHTAYRVLVELREDDLIKNSGLIRLTNTNRPEVVWKVTDLGAKIGWCMINAGNEFH